MTYKIPSKIEFADDMNVWSTNRDPAIAASVVQSSLTEIVSWNNKWRLFLSKDKTKIICFPKNIHHEVEVILDQHKIEQVSSNLCLGVVLDENLHFSKHISYACSKAIKALNKVCMFLSNTGLNTRNSIILYKSLVRLHLEYAYPVWASVKEKDLIKIDRIQRTALLKASGCLNSTPTFNQKFITNTFETTRAYFFMNILGYYAKKTTTQLELLHSITKTIEATSNPQLILPAQMMLCAVRPNARRINLSDMDSRDPKYDAALLCCRSFSRKALSLDQLGNSNTRTDEQANKAKRVAAEYINNINKNSLICFTDGSALGNPGPCGAGAAVYVDSTSGAPVLLKRPVAKKSISYHGDIAAIDLALEFAQPYHASHQNLEKIVILLDRQAVINTVCNHEYPSNFKNIICKINERIKDICNKNVTLEILWVAGHVGIQSNDLADQCAKEAALQAEEIDFENPQPLSFSEIKKEIKSDIINIWQRQWDRDDKSQLLHQIKPTVSDDSIISPSNPSVDKRINRLMTGHSNLSEHRWNMKIQVTTSPVCKYGKDNGSVEHYLLDCSSHEKHR